MYYSHSGFEDKSGFLLDLAYARESRFYFTTWKFFRQYTVRIFPHMPAVLCEQKQKMHFFTGEKCIFSPL
jgi:hypothetical protein